MANVMISHAQDSFTLADIVRHQAEQRASSPAVTFGEHTITYRELDTRSSQAANALHSVGVRRGDRVAILSKNSPAFYELVFACSKIGAIMTGLNWRLAPPEIEAIVADAAPAVILVADEQRPLLTEAASAFPTLRTVISLDTEYEPWIAAYSTDDPMVPGSPDDVVLLLYTSGTTGVPKGVELTNTNMSYSRLLAFDVWHFGPQSVNLVGMPMFHIGGIGYGMSAVIAGGHTILMRDNDAPSIISAIARHRVTHAFFVPAVIQSIVSAPEIEHVDVSSLMLINYGAAPISEAVLTRAIAVLGCEFTQSYGMTETAGTIVSLPPSDHQPNDPDRVALLRSCGKALPFVEIGLFDPTTGQQVPTGQVGEIWVRSEMVMRGYRNNPTETATAVVNGEWLRTGDAAYANAEGYLFLFDRYKDMIVSGGENIYPAEVENALYDHPSIAEVAVIGIPHERWGESPNAVVVLRPGAELTAEALIEFARQRLARYKCPTTVTFIDALPRNASGKILKKDLRAPYWVDRERKIS